MAKQKVILEDLGDVIIDDVTANDPYVDVKVHKASDPSFIRTIKRMIDEILNFEPGWWILGAKTTDGILDVPYWILQDNLEPERVTAAQKKSGKRAVKKKNKVQYDRRKINRKKRVVVIEATKES